MTAKYSNIQAHHIYQPVADESLGPVNASVVVIVIIIIIIRDGSVLFQRLSVLIQCFNAVLHHDCFVNEVAGLSS